MARVAINTGASANDGLGDNLRAAGGILNSNFLELYTYLGAGSTTVLSAPIWSSTNAGINTLRNVGIGTTNPRFVLEVGAVGASGTTLFVNGDARVTGIVTIGPASITLNGITNIINVGTGITINGSTGIISATAIVIGGTTLTGSAVTSITAGSGISVNQSTGNVTITATGTGSTSQWVTTAAGIHTLSNVGIGTTNSTSKLTVTGNGIFTGVVTATTFVGALTGTATTATNAQGLTGTPNITVGVATASTLNVGTSGTVITTTTAGLVGIGTTNPTSALTVVGASGTTLLVTGGTIPIQIGGNEVSGTIFKVGQINLSGPNASDVNSTYYSNILYQKVGDFRYNLEFHSGGYTGYGGAAPAGGPGDFIFYKRDISYGRAERFRISGETGDITSQGGVIAASTNVSGVATASTLNVGTGGTVITTTTAGLVGIGTTNPTSALTVGAVGSATTNLVVNGFAKIDQIVIKNNSNNYQDNIIMTQHPAVTFTGNRNVAIGDYSFATPGAAGENVAIGYYALSKVGNNNTSSTYNGNTAVGSWSGENATTTLRNTFIGWEAGKYITSGSENVILGSYNGNFGGLDIRTSSNNVVLSDGAGNIRFYVNSSGNVGLGTTNPTSKLTVSGDALINGLTVGLGGSAVTSNTAIGAIALYSNTGGVNNTANGYRALYSNTNGDGNTATGHQALYFNTTGDFNTANGAGTLSVNTGEQNTATGYGALNANTTGNFNTAIGVIALGTITTGTNNTGIGASAGIAITTGSKNTLLGSYTGNQNGLDIRTSNNNVVLSDGDGNIRLYANSTGNVGIGTTNPTEKLTVVGVTSSTSFYGDASYTASGRWTLGANGSADYTFVGIGFTQTTNDPVLYLARGRVYEFVNNSGGSHPFQIRVSNGGAAYNDGVTNNGGASGVIRFEIPFNAPNTLYYQCTVHSGMGNTISVYPNTI